MTEKKQGRKAAVAPARPFSAEATVDPQTGWRILVLRYDPPGKLERRLEARIAADAGANLFSLKLGDEELLAQADTLAELQQQRTGTPILFPTPNRVRDSTMTFEGRRFRFEANSNANFIHGLVRQRAWQSGAPVAAASAATATLWIDWTPAQPDFARFPLPHRLTVTFTLRSTGLGVQYRVDNRSEERLPFGFALHPFFRVPGARKDVFLWVPVPERMQAEALLPTGKRLKVAGTRFDLRKPTSLERLDLDDVFLGVTPTKISGFELRDQGVAVTLGATKDFTHMVVYTPPGRAFFCMENQTCSTDAHNLREQGFEKEAHLLVVSPGKSLGGAVDWRIRRTRAG
jgi:aldose 1-epimerase